MNRYRAPALAGPAIGGPWHESVVTDAAGLEVAMLSAPDASNGERVSAGLARVHHVVLARPAVARGTDGSPRMSLTLVLDRTPSPSEANLVPLIQRAVLGVDLTVAPSPALLESSAAGDDEHRALFPLEAAFSLTAGEPPAGIAGITVHGGQATAALSATLDRPEAVQFLDALSARDSPLRLGANLKYRAAATARPRRFSMNLEVVHEFLSSVAAPDRVFYDTDLQNYVRAMIERGIVGVEDPTSEGVAATAELARQLLPSFLRGASVLLHRTNDDPASVELGKRYVLSDHTPASMVVAFGLSAMESATTGTLEIQAPLQEVLPEALRGQNLDALMHLVTMDEGGRGFSEIPRRVRGAQARPGPPGSAIPLATVGRSAVSLSNAVRPSLTAPMAPHSMLAAQPHHGRLDTLALTGLAITHLVERRRHLPVIENGDDGLWPDRIDSDHRLWYAPAYEVVSPAPTSQPEDSPFLFSFRTAGHDLHGRPGLEATIHITLRRVMPEAARRRLEALGDVRADPVEMKNLSIALEIPFRDQSGTTQRERCRATSTEVDGDRVKATFQLLDDWVRMCYGALAYVDFQPGEPARVSIAYAFDAYTLIEKHRFELVSGGKSLRLPLVKNARERDLLSDRLHVDARDGSVRYRGGELSFSRAASTRRARPRPAASVVSLPASPAVHLLWQPVVRPEVHVTPAVVEVFSPKEYARVERVRSSSADVVVPCNEFGSFYVEETDGGRRAIGCQESFRLGQTEYRLYEELSYSRPGYGVLRSRQTPGRFVVVPDEYNIGRFEPSEGERAYRPLVLLYSTIDIDDLESSRCVIMATLQPDLPVFERQSLLHELRENYHPNPTLEYITELEGEVSYDWALPTTGAGGLLRLEAEASRLWDSFQVSLVTDAIGVPQLQAILSASGVSGSAMLRLPDGTSHRTTLRLDLSRIVGPWETGPVETSLGADGNAVLRNRIESTVNISEMLTIVGHSIDTTVPVDTRLAPGAQVVIPLPSGAAEVLPVYSVEASPAGLTEIRSFIEDIEVNLVLLNRLDFESLELKKVRIKGRVEGLGNEDHAEFAPTSNTAGSLDFSLPLTAYLADPNLELQATVTGLDDQERQLVWRPWNLSTQGVIVELTPEFIGLERQRGGRSGAARKKAPKKSTGKKKATKARKKAPKKSTGKKKATKSDKSTPRRKDGGDGPG